MINKSMNYTDTEIVNGIIDDILNEAYGLDNTITTINPKLDKIREYRALREKEVLKPWEHKRMLKLQDEIATGKYDLSVNPNTPVEPEWLKDEKMSIETMRKWHKYYPHDEEIARKLREYEEYENMLRVSKAEAAEMDDSDIKAHYRQFR